MSDGNEITFSGSSAAIKRGLRELDRVTLTPYNRLQSILHDRCVILEELAKVGLSAMPIFGNARTGCWYVPDPSQSVVFKSTDGHYGTWDFSLRRLNLQFLLGLQKSKEAVIVDATKAGQRYPDAIKRTIPIWCLVWSAVLSGSDPSKLDLNELFLSAITLKERDLILQQVEKHIINLKKLMSLIIGVDYHSKLECLFPFHNICCRYWYIGQTGLCHEASGPLSKEDSSTCVLHLVSVSKETPYPIQMLDEQGFPFYYIQGAADDAESWLSPTLTPSVFIANTPVLCSPEFASLDTNEYRVVIAKLNLVSPVQETFAYVQCPKQIRVIVTNNVDLITKEPQATCISLHRPNQPLPSNLPNVISIPVHRNLKYTTNLSRMLESIHATFQSIYSKSTVIFYSGKDYQVALAAFVSSMASANLAPRISRDEQGHVGLSTVPSTELNLVGNDPKQRILLMDIWESSLSTIFKAFSLQKNLRQAIHSFTRVCSKTDNSNEPRI